jgi:hypothetical protein
MDGNSTGLEARQPREKKKELEGRLKKKFCDKWSLQWETDEEKTFVDNVPHFMTMALNRRMRSNLLEKRKRRESRSTSASESAASQGDHDEHLPDMRQRKCPRRETRSQNSYDAGWRRKQARFPTMRPRHR